MIGSGRSVGSGRRRFQWIAGWGDLPRGVSLGDVPAVAVDSRDRLFVFSRGPDPVIVFDREGRFERTFGHGLFVRPHGLHIAPDDTLYCVDDEGQCIRLFAPDGRPLGLIQHRDQSDVTGYRPGYPHSVVRSAPPFCYPTGAALLPDGATLAVTDGYGNARLHWFDRDGSLRVSRGDPGSGPGEFVTPHGIWVEQDGDLYVSDRENERVQIFDRGGGYHGAWCGVHCPNNLVRDRDGYFYVAELGRRIQGVAPDAKLVPDALPARISVRGPDGAVIDDWRAREASGEDPFFAPHGIAIDSRGDLYVGEVRAAYGQGLAPPGLPVLHKFIRRLAHRRFGSQAPAATRLLASSAAEPASGA